MKFFTKSVLVAVAMMAGVTTANAQSWQDDFENWVEVEATMWHQWGSEADPTHCKKDAVITGEMTPAWFLNADRGGGECIIGAENVTWNLYADVSDYDYLIIFGSGAGCRVMCNRIIDEGAWKNLVIGFNESDPYWNADLSCLGIPLADFKTMTCSANGEDAEGVKTGDERIDDFVHLHCLKNAWGGDFPVNISSVYLWKANDPTGIKNVKANVEDGGYYNLAGQKVVNPEKGVFIHNGKKIVKK